MAASAASAVQIALVRLAPAGAGAADEAGAVAWFSCEAVGNDVSGPAIPAPSESVLSHPAADRAQSLLSPQEAAECARLRHEDDRRTYACAHALARIGIARAAGLQPAQVRWSTGAFGKPGVANAPGLHFSISYRRGCAAVAVAEAAVGIDLENTARVDGLAEVAQRWFHADELAHLAGFADAAWAQQFFSLWTRKEALLKAAGLGVDFMPQAAALKSRALLLDEAGAPRSWLVQHFATPGPIALAMSLAANP